MRWIPGDATHPPRPDLPIVRHLTYAEVHAVEIGFWAAFGIALVYVLGGAGAVVAVVGGVRVVWRRYVGETDTLPRQLRQAIREVWYLLCGGGAGLVAGYLAGLLARTTV